MPNAEAVTQRLIAGQHPAVAPARVRASSATLKQQGGQRWSKGRAQAAKHALKPVTRGEAMAPATCRLLEACRHLLVTWMHKHASTVNLCSNTPRKHTLVPPIPSNTHPRFTLTTTTSITSTTCTQRKHAVVPLPPHIHTYSSPPPPPPPPPAAHR
eukprot:364089-Chlamydomonas_euryale.AAC.2